MLIDNVIRLADASQGLWDSVLSSLRSSLSANSYDMWFGKKNLTLDCIENGCAKLIAANELVASWINGQFREALLEAFKQADPEITDYSISVSSNSKASQVMIMSTDAANEAAVEKPVARKPQISREEKALLAENAKTLASFYANYSFDTFVEGDSNRIALAMCRTIAENPTECSMNPFFLFGGPGVGKTHLLQSIGRYAIMYSTASRVVFRTAEQFLKDFMRTQDMSVSRAERADAIAELRSTYEDPQLLLIDDIQVIAGIGHGATEKALFQVLQKRVAAKRQTVFCADRRPTEIPNLYDGFTHFDGNSIAVDVPDFLTRLNILRKKANALQIPVEERDRIFRWVAQHQRGNVREMEGVVTKLFAYHDLLGVNLTLDTFKELCESCNVIDPANVADKPIPTISSIKEMVANAYHVSVESLRANTRVKSVSTPRKVAMYFCRELTKESLLSIGFQFGRDYTTVIASIKAVERDMRHDPEFASSIENLRASFAI
jgi:chromosomal replication initiator protein